MRDFLLLMLIVERVRTIVFGYCLSSGIAPAIGLEGGLLFEIVRTNDFCLLLTVAVYETIDLGDCLLVGIFRLLIQETFFSIWNERF